MEGRDRGEGGRKGEVEVEGRGGGEGGNYEQLCIWTGQCIKNLCM